MKKSEDIINAIIGHPNVSRMRFENVFTRVHGCLLCIADAVESSASSTGLPPIAPVPVRRRRRRLNDDGYFFTTLVPADRIAVARAVLTNGWLWRSLLGVEFVSVYKPALQPMSYLLPNDLWIEY
jgi:hypothetical protein